MTTQPAADTREVYTTLENAIDRIPPTWVVRIIRDSGSCLFYLSRKENGRETTIMGNEFDNWREAFLDVWSKL